MLPSLKGSLDLHDWCTNVFLKALWDTLSMKDLYIKPHSVVCLSLLLTQAISQQNLVLTLPSIILQISGLKIKKQLYPVVSCRQVNANSKGRKQKLHSWWIKFDFCSKRFWLKILVFPPSNFFPWFKGKSKQFVKKQFCHILPRHGFLNLKILTLWLGFCCDRWEKSGTAGLWEDREH